MICLVTAMVLGVATAVVFQYKSKHTAGFSLTLALLPMVVAIVIMLVNGNIGTGIAVAGAFTLVRFRSIPGTAKEICAIFVAMALGLAIGMGYVGIAALFFVLVSVFVLLLTTFHFGAALTEEKQLKITIPENLEYDTLFDDIFEKYTESHALEKVRTSNMGTLFELTYRIALPGSGVPKQMLDEIRVRNGNLNISVGDFSEKDML